MTSLQAAQLRQNLSLIGRTREAVPFLYCPVAADGMPALLTAPERLDPAAVAALMRGARDRGFVRGQISRDAGALVLRVATGPVERLVADLDGVLDEIAPGLRFARVDQLAG